MKRKAFTTVIVSTLLFSIVVLSPLVRFGEANWLFPTYQDPPDAPTLTIDLPVHNEAQNTNVVNVVFTVCVKGWNEYFQTNISRIGYCLDGKPYVWFVTDYETPQTDGNGLTAFNFSMELTELTEGIHSLTASAQYMGKYSPAPYELENFSVIGYSQEISFSIDTHTIPEFPSWVFLPLFVTTTLAVILCKNRLPRKISL